MSHPGCASMQPPPPIFSLPLPSLAAVSPSMSRMDAADSRSLIAASCLALAGHLATAGLGARFDRQLVICGRIAAVLQSEGRK